MFTVGGRRVKIVTGRKSQSVNVCTATGLEGEYECVVRIRPPFADEHELEAAGFGSIEKLLAHLRQHYGGDFERVGSFAEIVDGSCGEAVDLANAADASPWVTSARAAIEMAIDDLVREFIELPYLHRCEHSIHCRLYQLLVDSGELGDHAAIGRRTTQLVHKEWPEYRPRPGKRGRGNFDLAVLSPHDVQAATLDEFLLGRIHPSFVIEMGLDDDLEHLSNDVAKFKNSGIAGSYVVHLVREHVSDHFDSVEDTILHGGVRSAYARLISCGQARYKLVNDSCVSETTPA